jgi:hypothetical protein
MTAFGAPVAEAELVLGGEVTVAKLALGGVVVAGTRVTRWGHGRASVRQPSARATSARRPARRAVTDRAPSPTIAAR